MHEISKNTAGQCLSALKRYQRTILSGQYLHRMPTRPESLPEKSKILPSVNVSHRMWTLECLPETSKNRSFYRRTVRSGNYDVYTVGPRVCLNKRFYRRIEPSVSVVLHRSRCSIYNYYSKNIINSRNKKFLQNSRGSMDDKTIKSMTDDEVWKQECTTFKNGYKWVLYVNCYVKCLIMHPILEIII